MAGAAWHDGLPRAPRTVTFATRPRSRSRCCAGYPSRSSRGRRSRSSARPVRRAPPVFLEGPEWRVSTSANIVTRAHAPQQASSASCSDRSPGPLCDTWSVLSGCGKSTSVNLLQRLYEVDLGGTPTIVFAWISLSNWLVRSLHVGRLLRPLPRPQRSRSTAS